MRLLLAAKAGACLMNVESVQGRANDDVEEEQVGVLGADSVGGVGHRYRWYCNAMQKMWFIVHCIAECVRKVHTCVFGGRIMIDPYL